MDVELLVVPVCPSKASALDLTRAALEDLGVPAAVTTTVIESDEQAQARGFTGSPTFLINGQDPFVAPGAAVGVACRLYRTPAGLAGVPLLEELREALRRAATAKDSSVVARPVALESQRDPQPAPAADVDAAVEGVQRRARLAPAAARATLLGGFHRPMLSRLQRPGDTAAHPWMCVTACPRGAGIGVGGPLGTGGLAGGRERVGS